MTKAPPLTTGLDCVILAHPKHDRNQQVAAQATLPRAHDKADETRHDALSPIIDSGQSGTRHAVQKYPYQLYGKAFIGDQNLGVINQHQVKA
jgi:hypothetical protein